MFVKGEKTRTSILEAAARLFTQSGYSGVTMSDICAATGLSRGGLYRYFKSTEDVFLSLLSADKDGWLDELESAFKRGVSAREMLRFYLDMMHEGMQLGEGRLSLAAYEYVLQKGEDSTARSTFARDRFEIAADMLRRLFEYGQASGEFGEFDARSIAERDVILVDGLFIASVTLPLDEDAIVRQLDMIYDEVLKKREERDN